MALKTLKLRAHHVGWLSMSYEDMADPAAWEWDNFRIEFKREMFHFFRLLAQDKDMPVEIVQGADFLCKGCKKYSEKMGECGGYYTGEDENISPEDHRRRFDKEIESEYDLSRVRTVDDLIKMTDSRTKQLYLRKSQTLCL